MSQEQQETNGSRNDGLNKENLMNDHRQVLTPRRTVFKERKWSMTVRSRCSSWLTVRWRAVSRNGALLWWSSDREWTIEMLFHRTKKRMRHFRSPVGFKSNDHDVLMDPPILNYLSRYNYRDWRPRSTHLSEFYATFSICWSGGPRVHRIHGFNSSRCRSDARKAATSPAYIKLMGF